MPWGQTHPSTLCDCHRKMTAALDLELLGSPQLVLVAIWRSSNSAPRSPVPWYPGHRSTPVVVCLLLWPWEVTSLHCQPFFFYYYYKKKEKNLGEAFRLQGELPQSLQGNNVGLLRGRETWQGGHPISGLLVCEHTFRTLKVMFSRTRNDFHSLLESSSFWDG